MKPRKSLGEQIAELQAKIQLLEGDRKAFYESSQWTMKKNHEKIQSLRQECKTLRAKYAQTLQCDKDVVEESFQDHKIEKNSFKNKSGREAIVILDNKKCDALKSLNLQKAVTQKKENELQELENKLTQLDKDVQEAKDTEEGESEAAQRKRRLENRLDKAQLKLQEAENMTRTYKKILVQLHEERLEYSSNLEKIEEEIEKNKAELKELKEMNKDAEISRDAAKCELQRQEDQVQSDRKTREAALADLKNQAEEKRVQQERMDRRMQTRASMNPDQDVVSDQRISQSEDTEKKISTFEEAFRRIKEATGVADTQEVVARFRTQNATLQNLVEHKEKNQKLLEELEARKEKLVEEFDNMKYTGEAKLSSGQRLLEEFQGHLKKEEERKMEVDEKLESALHILVNVTSGIEHLQSKLSHLKGTKGVEPKTSVKRESEEYAVDVLANCEDKLLKLVQDLGEMQSVEEIEKEMEEAEFQNIIEEKLPQYNTRVKLPVSQAPHVYDEEEDSGEDEDVLTRVSLKKAAQQLVESKQKRRTTKKKRSKNK